VCITGGEPTIHGERLLNLMASIKNLGLKVKLDTNGYLPHVIERAIEEGLVDYIAMDVKNSLEKYSKTAGVNVDVSRIIESIEIIKSFKMHEFRTTVVPTLHDEEDIKKICELIKGARLYAIQNFSNKITLDPEFKKIAPFPREKLERFRSIAERYVKREEVRAT
jgi:pyruvate formate lyase activating enzyme